jgi:hypothetical protein
MSLVARGDQRAPQGRRALKQLTSCGGGAQVAQGGTETDLRIFEMILGLGLYLGCYIW